MHQKKISIIAIKLGHLCYLSSKSIIIMKRKITYCLLLLFCINWSCSEDDDTESPEVNIEVVEELTISEEILVLVNQHRQSIGKSILTRDTTADYFATEHSNYMIAQNKISHDNFSNRFQDLQDEVNAISAGENVASGYPTAEAVMEAWLNSPGHRANIEGDFTHLGIASIKNAQGIYYYTQLFYR